MAGGGASVIYADTVGDLGFASELGNYAGELHLVWVLLVQQAGAWWKR